MGEINTEVVKRSRSAIPVPEPANIKVLHLTAERLRNVRPVTSLDITVGSSSDLHPEGLYSTEIFGAVGTPQRDLSLSYIDLKTEIIIPKLFKDLIRLKGLYGQILSGRGKAVFNKATKDFEASNDPQAETGYGFFMRHWNDLQLNPGESLTRQERVTMLNRNKDTVTTRYATVIAAGLRDAVLDETGRWTKHEINDLYYRLISISNTIYIAGDPNDPTLDTARYQMTLTYLAIYELLESMVSGKKGFMLQKFGGRKVDYGTRNVLTASDNSRVYLTNKTGPTQAHTIVGLFQAIKSIGPVVIHKLMTNMLAGRIEPNNTTAQLVNPKTLERTSVTLEPEDMDRWASSEGVLQVVNSYYEKENRHKPVTIAGHYLALIYSDDKHFRVFDDINELPEGFDAKNVRPISLCEMIYLSGYADWNKYPMIVTRYPWSGVDSTYPSFMYVKTTVISKELRELGLDWQPLDGDQYMAGNFPDFTNNQFYDSQSPASSRLKGLGGDYDGDTGSGTSVITQDTIQEITNYLGSTQAWVSDTGSMRASSNTDTVAATMRALTRRKQE